MAIFSLVHNLKASTQPVIDFKLEGPELCVSEAFQEDSKKIAAFLDPRITIVDHDAGTCHLISEEKFQRPVVISFHRRHDVPCAYNRRVFESSINNYTSFGTTENHAVLGVMAQFLYVRGEFPGHERFVAGVDALGLSDIDPKEVHFINDMGNCCMRPCRYKVSVRHFGGVFRAQPVLCVDDDEDKQK